MNKVNVAEKLASFSDYWNPRIIGELNDSHVKAVKLKGDFLWHHHDSEDEMFFVVKGLLRMGIQEAGREKEVEVRSGEFIIIPRGVEHLPKADPAENNGEVELILFEPKTTLNTGNLKNERTIAKLERL